jgi:putative ABC transport system permease protein
MSFIIVVLRGLTRRRTRTSLTLLGISIGIAAVVALVGLSRGLNKSWAAGMRARGTDIVVSNMTSSLVPKPFNAVSRDQIAHLPHVDSTCAILVDLMSVENTEMIMVSAREWGGFAWSNLKLISGRMPNDAQEKAVVLGRTAAEVLKKRIGDPIQIETAELKVVGIVDGNAWVENGSVILSLPLLQEITGDQGRINVIDIRLTPSTSRAEVQQLCKQIDQLIPEARAILASDNVNQSEISRIIQGMSWSTSLLAVLVGVLGVMNTMLMNVFERTTEICVLLALGWKRSRIVELVLWESAILGLLGGIIGVFIGVVGVRILGATPIIRGLMEPDIGMRLIGVSIAIAVLVGVISGLYPAWRTSRVMPGQALHGS